jgi:methionine-rich copper-binding protein CopC
LFRALPRPSVPILLSLLLLGGLSNLAWAHAILMESTPKIHATVTGPDVPIHLRFNVRIDGSRSRVELTAPDGSATTLSARQDAPNILECNATVLKPGAYKLKWNVLASDGHMSKGEVPFTVK